jgi:hypothetical protein
MSRIHSEPCCYNFRCIYFLNFHCLQKSLKKPREVKIPGYAVLVEKVGLFLKKVGLFWKKPYFFSDCQVLVV